MRFDIHRAHPNLWVAVMGYGVLFCALAANFFLLHPTFTIFSTSNYVWGFIFLVLGIGLIASLNIGFLRMMRVFMWASVAYLMLIAVGTSQPYLDSVGSLQLPILYLAFAVVLVPLALEPPMNTATGKPPDSDDEDWDNDRTSSDNRSVS